MMENQGEGETEESFPFIILQSNFPINMQQILLPK